MIDAGYVRTMARYNSWQNTQLIDALKEVPDADLNADRGAFFGSIMATLNHLLWGDTIWLSRFTPTVAPPKVPASEHMTITPNFEAWCAERSDLDHVMSDWAAQLSDEALEGDLSWFSGMNQQQMSKPLSVCVVQLFNHQTHHRGQVHAMVTSLGLKAPVSDLAFMPEET